MNKSKKINALDFFDTDKNRKIAETLSAGKTVGLSNVKDGVKGLLALYLKKQMGGHVVLVMPSDGKAAAKYDKLKTWAQDDVLYFPAEPIHDYFADAHSGEAVTARVRVLEKTFGRKKYVIVTSPEALMKRLFGAKRLKPMWVTVKTGDITEPQDLADRFVALGYVRVSQVEAPGQFARRGEIVDIFPVTAKTPVRLDFFDDEVETIAEINQLTQRSEKQLSKITVAPVSEVTLSPEERQDLFQKIAVKYTDEAYEDLFAALKTEPGEHDETLAAFAKRDATLFDYLGDRATVFYDDYNQAEAGAKLYLEKATQDFETLAASHDLLPEEMAKFYTLPEVAERGAAYPTLYTSLFEVETPTDVPTDMGSESVESFVGRVPYFCDFIKRQTDGRYRIAVCCPDAAAEKSVKVLLDDQDLRVLSDGTTPGVCFVRGDISEGFTLPADNLTFLRYAEIFGTPKRKKRRRKKQPEGRKIDNFTSLAVGDYVVHDIHGIGIYEGIEQMTIGDTTKDMIVIAYQGDDKLYLPVDQMNAITAYIGTGGERKPKINTLGRPDWAKTKAKAKKAVEDMADELIALYAERRAQKGYAFGKDTPWQQEFEDSFPYEETDDQLRCVEEIKADMESETPMDRLLCGDVGYGKTEVALRAAFKAVMDNKQVAMLVPTTILAQQHYDTMRERFKKFPVTIEVLSRFRTPKQQKQVVADLTAGKVDIVVGTHRLLSKDIAFKDLGLLIVDEEQRFGVRSKEKLKQLRKNVDVLTLSATPIPRTLHMSMTGIRDMSVITEPPVGRRPVRTYVLRDNPVVIGDAISREIHRGGQVYYVHNRIKDIDDVAARIAKAVPGVKLRIAHGKMTGEQLEDIMQAFVDREFDVLVTTAIVESGLDVRNANTMIVDDGDAMGLSQLYQLRGRVGRGSHQAYCYILYKKKVLSEVAAKRLKALKDFTAFGSGFKVAMRDLEIRGAGNILGAEQSGHLFNIGYEMYCRILEETIAEHMGKLPENAGGAKDKPKEKAKPVAEKEPVKINLTVSAYIPDDYIDNEIVKYDTYKKIAAVRDEAGVADVLDELKDRFGNIPKPVRQLVMLSEISALAEDLNVTEITERSGRVFFSFASVKTVPIPDAKTAQALFERFDVRFKADKRKDGVWSIGLSSDSEQKKLEDIAAFLKMLHKS